ncbi:MAG: hypothetical protein ABIA75_07745 [Candidatus Neomarinimicrobiota bacterium]
MENFVHTNIFATKGIEYLIVIGFLLLVIPFWRYLNSPVRLSPVLGFSTIQAAVKRITGSIPEGVFLDPTHSWAFLESSGMARVGVDTFLLSATGPVNYRELRNPGDSISRGDVISLLEQDGKQLKIYSPISGVVGQRNRKLSRSFESNENFYSQGWLYMIKPDNWKHEVGKLLFAKKAEEWIKSEFDRLKDFFAFSTSKYGYNPELIVLQDGGALVDQALEQMPADIWAEFQTEFIDANKTE